jgi:hypothetical protein
VVDVEEVAGEGAQGDAAGLDEPQSAPDPVEHAGEPATSEFPDLDGSSEAREAIEGDPDPLDEELPPRYVADEEEEPKPSPKPKKKAAKKKKPVVDQEAPFIAKCSVPGCGKEFDPQKAVHWNHEGVFRCGKCGQFPK